ncbi:tetratricopeptide repeat protein 1 [Culicoides brevitarsis]|uniref:tetratricopeptide repeat protein 1 n=1 Tax=Culicoides brevitarsis TaxID=469753 RepID=UPI00307BB8E0
MTLEFDKELEEEELLKLEESMDDEELEKRKEQAEELKSEGNELFKNKEFESSVAKYTEALNSCPTKFKKERSILYGNRAAAKIQLEFFKSAKEDCDKSLELNDSYQKIYLRRATLNEKLEHLDESLSDFEKFLTYEPRHAEAQEGKRRLMIKVNERNEKLKAEALGKLKDLGNLVLRPFGLSTDNFQVTQNGDGGCSINFKQNE